MSKTIKDWKKFALRTCHSLHECMVCGGDITLGQEYRDGGYGRRAHEACANSPVEMPNDIWKDPSVKAALKEGRSADDIAVLRCPKCERWGYYNQGSHFYCRFCAKGWYCLTEDEEAPTDRPYMWLDGFTSLTDTVTECTDGYDNRTV